MFGKWRYSSCTISGAQLADAATVDANGKRTTQSFICKAVMTTDATVEEVLEYYRAKLKPEIDIGDDTPDAIAEGGRSVVFSDDSDDRPFLMHTILVNSPNASTTLVITRGDGESKTHIAWKHYHRFPN